jgi:hypothetical protein
LLLILSLTIKFMTMKKNCISGFAGMIIALLFIVPATANGQTEKAVIKKYLTKLPSVPLNKALTKYRMTAVYTNRDLYGHFTGKAKVTGDYTRGLPGDTVVWNNVYISTSQKFEEPFTQGIKKDYMENFRYIPSGKMVTQDAFKDFPMTPENVYARNVVWDMYSFEIFSWPYYDSLKLNLPFIIPDINGQFDMAGVGSYSHNKIMLCWNGISVVSGELCAVIDFNAIDNKLELSMDQIKSKGTEQYWGTILLSLKNKNIEHATMYSGTVQEIEVKGMKDKFIVKTIRELVVDKIQ